MAAVYHNGRVYPLKMGFLQNFLLCFFVFNFHYIHLVTCCAFLETQYGNVTEDQEIEVGSIVKFQCTLFSETMERNGVTSADLILKIGKEVLPYTYIVDNYTAEYEVAQSSVNDSGLYQCLVPVLGFSSPQLVCASNIDVGTKPLEVTNFTCIGYGYKNLSCSWTPPPNQVRTRYKLSDFLHNNPRFLRECPLANTRLSSCQFNVHSKPPYVTNQKTLNFLLKGENSLGTITQYFTMNHYEIVKPDVPSKVSLRDVSKTSMVMEILAPNGLENGEFENGLIYVIKFYSLEKLDTVKVLTVQNKTNAQLEIKNLVPHTQYKFEVRCRLNITGDRYYLSDEVNVTEITKPDVPYLAPEIDASGFDLQFLDNNATVTLYWKAVPSEFENGDNFHYFIKYHEHYVPTRFNRRVKRRSSNYVTLENSTMHTFKNLDKDTAYIFTVVAANDLGRSSNESAVIVVDKAKKLLPGPKDITVVLYNPGHYDISWKSPDPSLDTFTIAACETLKSRPAKCEGPISFISVRNKTQHKFSLLNSRTNYQFALAVTSEGRTSGLHWASCIATYGVLYGVKNLQMIPKTSTSLKLSWSYPCLAVHRVIREIEVSVCPSHEHCSAQNFERCRVNDLGGWPIHKITNTSITEMVIKDLHPFTQYYVLVRVRTDAGWGPYSDFGCESTMQSAPSDPPSDVNVEIQPIPDSLVTSIRVSFKPPNTPNGIISRYKVLYNKTSDGAAYHKEIRVQDSKGASTTLENIFYYTNYSVEVTACVSQACSPPSDPIYVFTGLTSPGIISLPRIELRDNAVNVSWDPPLLPNGPLDFYQLKMESNDSKFDMVYNVTDQNFKLIQRDCSKNYDKHDYEFKVRAVNMKDGVPFYGDYSKPLKTLICSQDSFSSMVLVFIIVGIIVGALIVGYISFYVIRCVMKNVTGAKKDKIQLPKGLEPCDNPINSGYDKFKSGLQNNHDSGIPNDRGYERFFSNASEADTKDAEMLPKRGASNRNLSGESNLSARCHDSISSANTTKTHNSIDSGAEIESPPSPDSFCSDSGSANTTPRAFKPGLDIVNEIIPVTSKDSGLDKEGQAHATPNLFGKDTWYVKRPTDAHLSAYSRFAVRGTTNVPSYVPCGEQNLVECLSLSNSEPSVADFDVGDGTEPLVNPVMHPYSKFGLARSASNGINISRESQPQNPGYSKFGTVYRPLKSSPYQIHDQQVFSATTSFGFPNPASSFLKKREDVIVDGKPPMSEVASGAYSKFGVVEADSTHGSNIARSSDSGSKKPGCYIRFGYPITEDSKLTPVDLGPRPESGHKQNQYCRLHGDIDRRAEKEEDSHSSLPVDTNSSPELCISPSESVGEMGQSVCPDFSDILLDPINERNPSHRTCVLQGHQKPQDSCETGARDLQTSQLVEGFTNKALTGGYRLKENPLGNETALLDATPLGNGTVLQDATPLGNETALLDATPLGNETALLNATPMPIPQPSAPNAKKDKPVNYAFKKVCSDVDKLFKCIDEGSLPELVVATSKPNNELNCKFFNSDGNKRDTDQTELPSCGKQNSLEQIRENGCMELVEMPNGKET